MYMSNMMSDLHDYMRVCVEEEYNEDEYYPEGKFSHNFCVGEDNLNRVYEEAELIWKTSPKIAESIMKALEAAHQDQYQMLNA